MNTWVDTYPHIIYASVLLLDGKIENWKVGQYKWNDIGDICGHWKMDRLNDYEIKTTLWKVNNDKEHRRVFNELAPKWFKQWKLADDFYGCKPY